VISELRPGLPLQIAPQRGRRVHVSTNISQPAKVAQLTHENLLPTASPYAKALAAAPIRQNALDNRANFFSQRIRQSFVVAPKVASKSTLEPSCDFSARVNFNRSGLLRYGRRGAPRTASTSKIAVDKGPHAAPQNRHNVHFQATPLLLKRRTSCAVFFPALVCRRQSLDTAAQALSNHDLQLLSASGQPR